MKQKTPMQEMFDQLKASRKDEYGLAFAIDMLLENEEVMLQKEKEVMDKIYKDSTVQFNISSVMDEYKPFEKYYNETFNTK